MELQARRRAGRRAGTSSSSTPSSSRPSAINMVALVHGRPKTLALREMVQHYIDHRHEIVVRRTEYDLRKAEERAHILEGLVDRARSPRRGHRHHPPRAGHGGGQAQPDGGRLPRAADGRAACAASNSPRAAPARTTHSSPSPNCRPTPSSRSGSRRLTGLAREQILDEYRDDPPGDRALPAASSPRATSGCRSSRRSCRRAGEQFGDARRSEIDYMGGGDIDLEDLIEDEPVVVTVSHQGLVKRTSITEYRQQGRGGRGLIGAGTRDEDFVEHLFTSSTHDYMLFFTDHGQCYWLRVYEVPEGSRTAKGRSIRNLIQIAQDDRVRAVLTVSKANFRGRGLPRKPLRADGDEARAGQEDLARRLPPPDGLGHHRHRRRGRRRTPRSEPHRRRHRRDPRLRRTAAPSASTRATPARWAATPAACAACGSTTPTNSSAWSP